MLCLTYEGERSTRRLFADDETLDRRWVYLYLLDNDWLHIVEDDQVEPLEEVTSERLVTLIEHHPEGTVDLFRAMTLAPWKYEQRERILGNGAADYGIPKLQQQNIVEHA